MRNIDESDAKPALEILQFKLHLFAQFIVKGTQRFVRSSTLGLLTTALAMATRCCWPPLHLLRFAVAEVFQLRGKHLIDALILFLAGTFFHHEAKANIVFNRRRQEGA